MSACSDYEPWPEDAMVKTRECRFFDGEGCEKGRNCPQDWSKELREGWRWRGCTKADGVY